MNKPGWLVNDCLTCICGTKTFWHNLLEWFPDLSDKTNGYTDYSILPSIIEKQFSMESLKPYYIIRNGTYFRKLNIDVKQISLIQDIRADKEEQAVVINNSHIIVFNTNYVFEKYKYLIKNEDNVRICPLGVDFEFFTPIADRHPDVLPNSIIFIGDSTHYPKGFNVLIDIIVNMPNHNFCLIMKDNYTEAQLDISIRDRVRVFNKINQECVRLLINSCVMAVCTSYEETQHLSGIECGACNIPIVSRKVGIYYDNISDNRWGVIADDTTFVDKINYVFNNIDTFKPRECFIEKYSNVICKNNWIKLIDKL